MKSQIAKKLILYTVLFSSAITLIITVVQLYSEFQHDVKGINKTLEQIKVSYQESITQSVWLADRDQLQFILDGITELPDIVYAKVNSGDSSIEITSGSISQSKNIESRIYLNYLYNNNKINIGEFIVIASLSDVYKRLLNRLGVILLSNALKTSLVAIFIYFLFSRLVTRHLSKISEFSENHNVFSNDEKLSLDRNTAKYDEFDAVVKSINNMHTRLREQLSEISYQKEYLSQTLNSIGDAVITTDNKGYVTRLNPVAEKLTGWTNDEALGQPLKTIFPIVNVSTREPIENPVEKVLATGETVYLSNHTTLIAKDGKEYQISDSAAPILYDDKIFGMVLIFNDVTEQYKMREKIQSKELEQREILQSMVDAVITIDEKGIVSTFNHSAEILFGYSVNEVLGNNIKQLMPDFFASSHDQYLQNYLKTGEAKIIGLGREVTGLRKNNETFPMRLYVAELPPALDGKRRFIGSCTDLSQIKEREEQLRRSQKMDALGKLTGGVAHDFNNILGIVLGYSDVLKDMLLEQPKLQNFADKIVHAGERGAKLTKKLLAFSKHKSSNSEKLNINTILQGEQHMLEKTLTARINLEFKLEKDLWPVYLDESELEDAIFNISINAMHAIENNGQLIIETSNEKINRDDGKRLDLKPGDYVKLVISDSGCGMDEATKEKIFDPFFTTKGDKGTGLGLSQVYGFIDRCGGAIKVDSELEQGACFTLYFPVYRGNDTNKQLVEIKSGTALKGNETILVVDDEPELLNLTCEILSQQDYQVFRAESAKQALQIMETEHIDLLISDVIMPDMDGFLLAAIVQEKHPDIKIQLASGFPGEQNIGHEENILSQNLLQKPYNAKTLLNRIRALLQ